MSSLSSHLERAAAALAGSNLDALILTPGADQFYLTGFEHGHAMKRLLALVLKRDGDASWIVPSMNVKQVRDVTGGSMPIRSWEDGEGYLPALREALQGVGSVAWDEEARSAFLMDLLSAAPGVRLTSSADVMRPLRLQKTPEELALLRAAGRTVDETIAEAISLCQPGRTEEEVDALLRAAMLRQAETITPGSHIGFTIIASGPNGAFPHHDTGRRVLQQGDVVIVDFGTVYQGYRSDITITCAIGEPADADARKVYKVVWDAQQRALEAVRPGVKVGDIDAAARNTIAAAGYGEAFLHRTGHGLGLQVHEPPYLIPGGEDVLEEGMVFSVEPGIYLEGRFGVRLEVIASVAADGVSLINAPRVEELPLVG